MRLRIGFALVVILLALPLPANAYTIGGGRWPSRDISYFNADASMDASVEQAVHAWNTSGARVQFVPAVTRGHADVIIRKRQPPRAVASVLGGVCEGYADIGHFKTPEYVDLSPRCSGGAQVLAGVVAHELGHILGLDHARRGCATMTAGIWQFCRPPRFDWQYRCRLLQPDDVRGAVALYGGHVRKKPPFCDAFRPPQPATNIRLAPDQIAVTWHNPPQPRLAIAEVDSPRLRAYIGFRQGACPRPTDPMGAYVTLANAIPGHDQSVLLPPELDLSPGSWCAWVSIRDQYGRGSTASTLVTVGGLVLGLI